MVSRTRFVDHGSLSLGAKKNNKHETQKHFSDGPCRTIVPGTNWDPSQGQTGQNGDFTVEFRNNRFVPGMGPVCPRTGPVCARDGSCLSRTPSRPKCLCLLVFLARCLAVVRVLSHCHGSGGHSSSHKVKWRSNNASQAQDCVPSWATNGPKWENSKPHHSAQKLWQNYVLGASDLYLCWEFTSGSVMSESCILQVLLRTGWPPLQISGSKSLGYPFFAHAIPEITEEGVSLQQACPHW